MRFALYKFSLFFTVNTGKEATTPDISPIRLYDKPPHQCTLFWAIPGQKNAWVSEAVQQFHFYHVKQMAAAQVYTYFKPMSSYSLG